MWIYRKLHKEGERRHWTWTVGYYAPSTAMNDGWVAIRDMTSEDHARAECNYLNGGDRGDARPTYYGEELLTLQQRVYDLEEAASERSTTT